MKKRGIIIFLGLLLAAKTLFAGNVRFDVELEEETTYIGNPTYMYLSFYGAQNVQRPHIQAPEGLKVQYVGPSTEMSIVNGQVSSSVKYSYLLVPLKKGAFTLGPFYTEYNGEVLKAGPVTLNAIVKPKNVLRSSPSPGRASAPSTSGEKARRRSSDVSDQVFMVMEVPRTQMYINDSMMIRIKVYVTGAGLRDIEFPSYPHNGFSTGEYREPKRGTEYVRGVRHEVLTFDQEVFAVKEGDHVLGPASMECKMVVKKKSSRRTSFFGRVDFFGSGYATYPLELSSEPVEVKVLPFPEGGKPASFKGAVGSFSMDASVIPSKVKVGDPVVLRTAISGRGNLETVTAPEVEVTGGLKAYEPQVALKGNSKVYERIFIPRSTNVEQIPAVSFSFFDTSLGRYRTITEGPFPITVEDRPESEKGVRMVSPDTNISSFFAKEELGKDIIHIKETPGRFVPVGEYLFENVYFWGAQFVPMILFLIFYFSHRKKMRIETDRGYARSLRAPKQARKGLVRAKAHLSKGEITEFYDAAFKTLYDYLGNRLNMPKGAVSAEAVEERIREYGCEENVIRILREVNSECEMARYASSGMNGDRAGELMAKVRGLIDSLERMKI